MISSNIIMIGGYRKIKSLFIYDFYPFILLLIFFVNNFKQI